MDIQVKHSGSDITSHVTRYDRETKICTGIGMLEVEIEYTCGRTFDPWDVIDIYENGNHAGKYYVSSVAEGQPSSTFVVSAQDNSKRLSDYFITDTYLIDYPSYTRYWIELFLTEAGISFSFLTTSQGSLLSNNTSLGLMSAYEQVLMLLQMSGWYIRFNSSGRAIIGKLDADKAKNRGTLNNTDIIEIKVDKNDRMYRNRVVVWGNGDPATSRWVFADVRKPTKWDYDRRDLRTILISNSNIPTVADAFMLANKALTEFARLNIEKYLTVEDARNISVGDVVSIRTKVFSGKAMVTTFGVSMSKSGLVSNIACDERCPRLFGFFNPGGYVYVGTFGSGVWRKHILDYERNGVPSGTVLSGLAEGVYSGGWFDYSSGLQDMNVTDLHVNNGVLASVTSSGQIYYSLEDMTPWSGIVLSGLNVTYSGSMVDSTVYSGLMGRACIIDRDTNYLRYAIDTRSGENLGDFLLESNPVGSGLLNMFQYAISGYTITSGNLIRHNSWILDANPYDGLVENTYPIHVSGNYNFAVYDIENDGSNDYVEAMTYGSGVIPQYVLNGEFNGTAFGGDYYQQAIYNNTYRATMAYSGFPTPVLQNNQVTPVSAAPEYPSAFSVWDGIPEDDAYASASFVSGGKPYFRVSKVVENDDGSLTTTEYQNGNSTVGDSTAIFVNRLSTSVFEYYCLSASEVVKYEYNIIADSLTRSSVCSLPDGTVRLTVGGNLYIADVIPRYYLSDMLDFEVQLHKIELPSGSLSTRSVLTTTGEAVHIRWFNEATPILFPYLDDDVILICPYTEMIWIEYEPLSKPYHIKLHRYTQNGFSGSGSDSMVYDYTTDTGLFGSENSFSVLSHNIGQNVTSSQDVSINKSRVCATYTLGNGTNPLHIIEDFSDSVNVYLESEEATESKFNEKRVYNMMDRSDYGLMRSGSDVIGYTFTKFNPSTGESTGTIADPSGYRLYDLAGVDCFNGELFFRATTSVSSYDLAFLEVIATNSSGTITRKADCRVPEVNCHMLTAGWFWAIGAFNSSSFYYVTHYPLVGEFPVYQLLQRDGWDFNVVKSGIYQERIDISNYSPLVTMDRRISSLETYFISQDGEVTATSNPTMSGHSLNLDTTSGQMFNLGILADDFRYSDFEDTTESGTSRRLFVVYSGSVGSIDLWTLDSFSGEFSSPSGGATRIEMSNYSLPDQFVFVSVSGYTAASGDWGFFQKSPAASGYDMTSSGVFVDYSSGYPQARTTIIRLDDSL